jgi:hydrogenase maturation protease
VSVVQVLGVGSPFGDDRVGWRVAEALAARPAREREGLAIHRLDRPGAALLAHLRAADRVVIVDALATDGPAGEVRVLDPAALAPPDALVSSHALGVAESLALLDALDEAPRAIGVVAVTINGTGGFDLSEPVAVAVTMAADAVLAVARQL